MVVIDCIENKFIFRDEGRSVMLLDCNNLIANHSRYPMQLMDDGINGIPRLIVGLREKHSGICGGEEEFYPYYLLDIIMTSHLIRTSAPLKILEIGATSGIMSWHLASLMGKLNRESLLCCVSNVIGNSSENCWLDRISMVEEPPNLALHVSDYEATRLETDYFDIVVLNGTAGFDKPYETIREAQRLVKKNGVMLCYAKDTPLLENCFQLVFPERQEYGLSLQEMLFVVNNPDTAWEQEKRPVLSEEVSKLFNDLRRTAKPGCRPEEVGSLIRRIDGCADMAMKCFDTDRKADLMQLKGMALDYMLSIGNEFEEYYRNALMENVK